ncbi:hypothetical protein ACOMHN_056929 [Nucella lapillus]
MVYAEFHTTAQVSFIKYGNLKLNNYRLKDDYHTTAKGSSILARNIARHLDSRLATTKTSPRKEELHQTSSIQKVWVQPTVYRAVPHQERPAASPPTFQKAEGIQQCRTDTETTIPGETTEDTNLMRDVTVTTEMKVLTSEDTDNS